jgi:hypothetical protein
MLVHEAAINGIESTGDVEGNKDENMCSEIDSELGSTAVHKDVFGICCSRSMVLNLLQLMAVNYRYPEVTRCYHSINTKDTVNQGGLANSRLKEREVLAE